MEKSNGKRPNVRFNDDLDYLKNYYTDEQIKELFESAKPKFVKSFKDENIGIKMWLESYSGIIVSNPFSSITMTQGIDYYTKTLERDRIIWKMKKRKALINKVVKWSLTFLIGLSIAYFGFKLITPFAKTEVNRMLLVLCLGMMIILSYIGLSVIIETDPNFISIKKSRLPLNDINE